MALPSQPAWFGLAWLGFDNIENGFIWFASLASFKWIRVRRNRNRNQILKPTIWFFLTGTGFLNLLFGFF